MEGWQLAQPLIRLSLRLDFSDWGLGLQESPGSLLECWQHGSVLAVPCAGVCSCEVLWQGKLKQSFKMLGQLWVKARGARMSFMHLSYVHYDSDNN